MGLDEVYLRNNAGFTESFLRDALNSTLAVTSASGTILDQVTYDPYGNNSDSNGSYAPGFKFTGREYEGTGFAYTTLYNLRGRYYDAALGRFISRDPAGLAGGINLYAYAGDDPVDSSDPTGDDCWGPCEGEPYWGPNWPTPNPTRGGGGSGGSGVVGAFLYQPQMLANTNGLERAVVQAYHGQNGGGLDDSDSVFLVMEVAPRGTITPTPGLPNPHPPLNQPHPVPQSRKTPGGKPPTFSVNLCDMGGPEIAGLLADAAGHAAGEAAAEAVAESVVAGAIFGGPAGVAATGFAFGFTMALPAHLVANALCGK